MPDLQELGEAIKRGDRDKSVALTQEAIDTQTPAQEILDVMVGAMDIVGQRFQKNEIFVPEMLIAARAMKESMALLEPVLIDAGITPLAKAVIGTVEGDLHDIGKNLVAMMWKGANFDVIDLGTNVSPQKFVDAVQENQAEIVGLSALLTTTMPAIKSTVEAIKERRTGCHEGGHRRSTGYSGICRRNWCRRIRIRCRQRRRRCSRVAALVRGKPQLSPDRTDQRLITPRSGVLLSDAALRRRCSTAHRVVIPCHGPIHRWRRISPSSMLRSDVPLSEGFGDPGHGDHVFTIGARQRRWVGIPGKSFR